jgi:hypothetical protein
MVGICRCRFVVVSDVRRSTDYSDSISGAGWEELEKTSCECLRVAQVRREEGLHLHALPVCSWRCCGGLILLRPNLCAGRTGTSNRHSPVPT